MRAFPSIAARTNRRAKCGDPSALARGAELSPPDEPAPATPTRVGPQRYKVQFTASEEYVKLVEAAKALLSHSAPRAGIGEIHLRAMRALVTELERQKYAVTTRPRQRARATSTPAALAPEPHHPCKPDGQGRSATEPKPEPEPEQARESEPKPEPEQARESEPEPEPEPEPEQARESEPKPEPEQARESESTRAAEPAQTEPAPDAGRGHTRWRGRYVSAAIRRAVFARDEGRCTYTGGSGQRCRETNGIELHHSRAFAQGGEHSEQNLTLRCRAHNTLAAEKDFGRAFIELARDSTEHEPWATHEAAHGHYMP